MAVVHLDAAPRLSVVRTDHRRALHSAAEASVAVPRRHGHRTMPADLSVWTLCRVVAFTYGMFVLHDLVFLVVVGATCLDASPWRR